MGTLPSLPLAGIRTPALLVNLETVHDNIRAVLAQLDGDARRWRPHVKTAKLAVVMQAMLGEGLTRFKCATTLELKALLDVGARDVLVAFPHVGANAARVAELAAVHPGVRVAALVEADAHLAAWRHTGLPLFFDVNPGMDRTGGAADAARLAALARAVTEAGCAFAGIHWYDGHMHGFTDPAERERAAHAGYDRLGGLVRALAVGGIAVPEVIVAGTPAAVPAATYSGFRTWPTDVQISPGTVVYNDTTSLSQVPAAWHLAPAAHVLTTVVSHPTPTRFTCDAGHKAVAADAGVPTCAVQGHPAWQPARPSEEHLPVDVPGGDTLPPIGAQLLLLPRHVCPTVNNFDEAVLIRGSAVDGVAPVSARGRESPLVK